MAERRTAKIERLKTRADDGNRTLSLFIRPGSRSRPFVWFEPAVVPDFEGDHAWFEVERTKGGWRVLHEVPKPSWER